MMKLQISNDQDRKEAQNRERRRQCELERRARIFNARNRKIGVRKYSQILSTHFLEIVSVSSNENIKNTILYEIDRAISC